MKKNYCIDCGKEISKVSKRCKSCFNKKEKPIQKYSKHKYCIKCGKKLILGKTWYNGNKNSGNYLCKKCFVIQIKPRQQQYIRERVVFSSRGRLIGEKRKRTDYCEICGRKEFYGKGKKEKRRLYYHHWDDNNLLKGIWVCNWCHQFIEGYKVGHLPKWLKMKKKITKEAGGK